MKRWLLSIVGAIAVFIAVPAVASAAPPEVEITQGVVAASQAATYAPATVGPVIFSASGSCPRWSGTINTTNLGSQPIDSNVTASQFDAGDVVTFAIVLRNASIDGDAFDVTLHNNIPNGFELPGTGAEDANLCVTRGDNTSVSFTSNGTGFFGSTENDTIELDDGVNGSLAPTHPTNGQDIVVITFDLVVAAAHIPNSTQTSTAQLLFYSDSEGGELIEGDAESATVKLGTFGRTKTLLATNQPFTTGNLVVVGEIATYQLEVQVPQGEIATVSIVDTLTSGLAFVGCDSITNDSPSSLSTNLSGGFAAACNDPTNPTVSGDGRTVTFTLGDLVNTNRNDGQAETITIVYRAVVINVPEVVSGVTLNNSAVVRWTGDNSAISGSAPVMVRESRLFVEPVISPTSGLVAGNTATVTITIWHDVSSAVPAFDAVLAQALPAGLTPIAGSLDCTGGTLTPDNCDLNGQTLDVEWSEFPSSDTTIITFEVTAEPSADGQTLQVPASVQWTSLPGDVSTPQSTYSALSTERTGDTNDPGSSANTYAASQTAAITIGTPPAGAPTAPGAGVDDPSGSTTPGQASGQLANTGLPGLAISVIACVLLLVALAVRARGNSYIHQR